MDGKIKKTTTDLVSTYTNKFGNTGSTVSEYTYTYDTWGSITKIKDLAGRQRTYTYNKYGEITNASETYSDGTTTTYAYTYDDGGNILSETIGNTVHKYKYDSVWTDKLTSYDGKAITYDDLGRPTNYMGKSMTWDKAGKLASVGNDVNYTYLSDGQRHTKTANGKTTTYNYNNGLLLSETNGDETLRYYYDSTGKIISFTYQKGTGAETAYFYTRNMQGDITAIYRNSDSKLIGTYEYDLWGKIVKETPTSIDTQGVLTKNPIRYRGYYYDTETKFYNLNARYYDPEVRRFISPDDIAYLGADGNSASYNLYVYCGDNPVNRTDYNGHACVDIKKLIIKRVHGAYAIYYGITKYHFEYREMRNGTHPSYDEVIAENSGWRKLPKELSVYHDNGIGDPEEKYITNDGREAVFDGNSKDPITDPRYMATYNYAPLYELPEKGANIYDCIKLGISMVRHINFDITPYYLTGKSNTREQFEEKCYDYIKSTNFLVK